MRFKSAVVMDHDPLGESILLMFASELWKNNGPHSKAKSGFKSSVSQTLLEAHYNMHCVCILESKCFIYHQAPLHLGEVVSPEGAE